MKTMHKRHLAIHENWITQSRTDPEFGGAQFEQNLKTAKNAKNHFGGSKLKKVLDETRMGSHPEIIRLLWKVGASMKQGNAANTNAPAKKSIGELFYPGFNT